VHAHDAVGNLIGFALVGVAGIADGEFCLNQSAAQKGLHGLVAGLLLQGENWMEAG
jgi:hypothetical protein